MNFPYSFSTVVWMFVIVKLNVSLVVSKLIPHLLGDPRNWRETGDNANLAKFNSLYAITIDEEKLNRQGYCSGRCDNLDYFGKIVALGFEYPNQCNGLLVRCWFHEESQRRRDAQKSYNDARWFDGFITAMTCNSFYTQYLKKNLDKLDHTGNTCKCLCERSLNSYPVDQRGTLLNSLCLDPVSIDKNNVVTGVRFRRHDKIIHLELQQAKFRNGRITSTPQWIPSSQCINSILVATYSPWNATERFSILAEDLVLSEDAVVTGVTLGESLKGRYINENGNFDARRDEFTKASQCTDKSSQSSSLRDAEASDEHPTVSTAANDNYERSESCKTRIFFRETSAAADDMQHVVPYVDLQEVVTDPPEVIHGIGWYLRGSPGYGGFLALKIFLNR